MFPIVESDAPGRTSSGFANAGHRGRPPQVVGTMHARGDLNLGAFFVDAENSKAANHLAASSSGRYTEVVAGESFLGASAENYEGFELDVKLD